MWIHRRARRKDLEAALRAQRSEPRDEYVRSLSGRLREAHGAPRVAWSRLAFAGAASTLILGMFASFGGLGYAASGATSTYSVVKQVVVKHRVSLSVRKSSADDEYPKETPAGTATGSGPGAAGVAVAGESKTLPFTGFPLALTVAISLAMIVAGLALRRRERRN
jgi:hypothetical protein